MDERLVRKLLSGMKCGVCGCHYDSGNIRILGHRDDLWFLSVYCPKCKSQGLVAAVVKESKVSEVMTELTPDEVGKLASLVNTDDVIDMVAFMRDFDGDFACLFGREQKRRDAS
jgi:hypothetical protein